MDKLFEKCIPIILKNEGGYVNHPHDPGGETKYGIAKRFFPDEDIKNLTIERAKEIYYKHYWLPMALRGIDNEESVLQIFDFGVNAGTRRAIRKAQQILEIKQDGVCGPITRKAINDYGDDFVIHYKIARSNYYEHLAFSRPRLRVFLRGWLNRIEHTKFN